MGLGKAQEPDYLLVKQSPCQFVARGFDHELKRKEGLGTSVEEFSTFVVGIGRSGQQ